MPLLTEERRGLRAGPSVGSHHLVLRWCASAVNACTIQLMLAGIPCDHLSRIWLPIDAGFGLVVYGLYCTLIAFLAR